MKINICISTVKGYSAKTIPVLYTSLLQSGIPPEDLLIVEGGHERRKVHPWKPGQSTSIETNHNSFDLTALIEIAEHNIACDAWFLMHDTCRVGPRFKELLYLCAGDPTRDKIALARFPSMNMGVYKYSYIIKHKDRLFDSKFTGVRPDNLMLFKQRACDEEDLILWKEKDSTPGVYSEERVLQDLDNGWYPTATGRIQEYFPGLDLYKLKANWGQTARNQPVSII